MVRTYVPASHEIQNTARLRSSSNSSSRLQLGQRDPSVHGDPARTILNDFPDNVFTGNVLITPEACISILAAVQGSKGRFADKGIGCCAGCPLSPLKTSHLHASRSTTERLGGCARVGPPAHLSKMVRTRSWRLTAEMSGGRWNSAPRSEPSARATWADPPGGLECSRAMHTYSLPVHSAREAPQGTTRHS